jgi:glutamyl-tRNA synthetase
MEGDVTGVAEPGFADVPEDEMVQFERVGFARVDQRGDGETVTYFAHP